MTMDRCMMQASNTLQHETTLCVGLLTHFVRLKYYFNVETYNNTSRGSETVS